MKTSMRRHLFLERGELVLAGPANEAPDKSMSKSRFFGMRRAKGKQGAITVGAPADSQQVPCPQQAVLRVQHKSSFQHIMEHRLIEDENGKCSNPKCSICSCWFLDKLPPGSTLNSSSSSSASPVSSSSESNSSTLTDLTAAAANSPHSSTSGVQSSLPAGFTCELTAATKPLDTMTPLASGGPFTNNKGHSSPEHPAISPGSAFIPAGQINSPQALLSAQGSSSSSSAGSSVFSSPRRVRFSVDEGQGGRDTMAPVTTAAAAAADTSRAAAPAGIAAAASGCKQGTHPACAATKTPEEGLAEDSRSPQDRRVDLTEDDDAEGDSSSSSSTCSDTITDMATEGEAACLEVVVDDGEASVVKAEDALPTAAASSMTPSLKPSRWQWLKSAVRTAFKRSGSRSRSKSN